MNVEHKFNELLDSKCREAFLQKIGYELGISARQIFAAQGSRDIKEARACNEMVIALWAQVRAAGDEERAYPDSELLRVLLSKADLGNARSHLRNAVENAMAVDNE